VKQFAPQAMAHQISVRYECIRDDPAALHAMISVVGRIQTLLLARKEDALVLKHEAEAVQSINYRLIEEQGLLSNGLIAAAAVLVNQEVTTLPNMFHQI
jgi:hypothetical protein